MLVAVDIGNTNIVPADGDTIAGTYRITIVPTIRLMSMGVSTEFPRMSKPAIRCGRCDHLFGGAESDALLPFVHRQIPRH